MDAENPKAGRSPWEYVGVGRLWLSVWNRQNPGRGQALLRQGGIIWLDLFKRVPDVLDSPLSSQTNLIIGL